MGAFKTLKKSDVYVVPYIANKQWNFSGTNSDLSSSYDIKWLSGLSNTNLFNPNTFPTTNGEYQTLVYSQIQQLYYSNFISSSHTPTSSYGTSSYVLGIDELGYFDNLNQSTLKTYKYFPSGGSGKQIGALSIPQHFFGSKIIPNSFNVEGNVSILGTNYFFDLRDDGEGNIYNYTSRVPVGSGSFPSGYVGNIIYPHGLVILTSGSTLISNLQAIIDFSLTFKGEHIVYENEVRCLVREDEFNFTQNPSATNYTGSYLNNITGSEFTPYVTTVGLYNEFQELLAVGKFAQPIPMSPNTDMTFVIRYDM